MNIWKKFSEQLLILLSIVLLLLMAVLYFFVHSEFIKSLSSDFICGIIGFLVSFVLFKKMNKANQDEFQSALLTQFSTTVANHIEFILPEINSDLRNTAKDLKQMGIIGIRKDFDFGELIDKISNSHSDVTILENWICKDFNRLDNAFKSAYANNAKMEIILLNPYSPFAIQRCKDLGDEKGSVTKNIENNIAHIQRLQNENVPINLLVHNSLPSLQIFICDNWCAIGFYLMGALCHDMPQLYIDMKNKSGQYTIMGGVIQNHINRLRAVTTQPQPKSLFEEIHHVNLPVRNLSASLKFYEGLLRLRQIERPDFGFPGAWLALPNGQHLHLVVDKDHIATFRHYSKEKSNIQPKDVHFALRVEEQNFQHILHEVSKDQDPLFKPFDGHVDITQMYIQDPDCHIIEITMLTDAQQKLSFLRD